MTKEEFNRTIIKEGICVICQNPFIPKRNNQICCSDNCKKILSAWRSKESSYFYKGKYNELETFKSFVDRKLIKTNKENESIQLSLFLDEGG